MLQFKAICILLLFFTNVEAQTKNIAISVVLNKDVFDVARKGLVSEMKALIEINSDTINKKNANGFTPLLLACYRGNFDVAEFLIPLVKNLNNKSDEGSALTAAVFNEYEKLVNLLLKNGADPNITNIDGVTALMMAAQSNNPKIVSLLINYKSNKSIKDNKGKTALDYALFTKNNEVINLLK
jgi:uncharacterized protein